MKWRLLAVISMVNIFDQADARVDLPEMPGPPYPDRWGNNRWGVRYNPRLHGSRRNQEGSSSSLHDSAGMDYYPEEINPPLTTERYHRGRPPPPRKFLGLKPLVSRPSKFTKIKRNRRRQQLTTSTRRRHNSDNISYKYKLKRNDNPRSYVRKARSSDESNVHYSTLNPQHDFFGNSTSRRQGTTFPFTKTLSNIYNDYKPTAENNDSPIPSTATDSNDSINSILASDNLETHSYNPPPRRRPKPRPSFSTGPTYVERPFFSSDKKRPPPSSRFSTRPLSTFDLYDDDFHGFTPGLPPSMTSSGPLTSYEMSGPPPSSSFSSSFDFTEPFTSSMPSSPFRGPFHPGPMNYMAPPTTVVIQPFVANAPSPVPHRRCKKNKCKPKKKRLQHTRMRNIKSMLDRVKGRKNRESEDEGDLGGAYADNQPLALLPPVALPPQLSYPAVTSINSLTGGSPFYAPPPPLPPISQPQTYQWRTSHSAPLPQVQSPPPWAQSQSAPSHPQSPPTWAHSQSSPSSQTSYPWGQSQSAPPPPPQPQSIQPWRSQQSTPQPQAGFGGRHPPPPPLPPRPTPPPSPINVAIMNLRETLLELRDSKPLRPPPYYYHPHFPSGNGGPGNNNDGGGKEVSEIIMM